ncbi:MAG: hypothetical protein KC493_10325 [Bacteriovoracaceae bacterium]|nr:hypothetical protein [Bacteriovoracaceae bacterium]
MKRKDLEILLQKANVDLYGYAYCLIPDELQASQLVMDAMAILTLDKKSLLEDLLLSEEEKEKRLNLFIIKKFLYRAIYKLSVKRINQIRSSLDFSGDYISFHGLNLEQKSAIYLKRKTSLELSDIQEILNIKKPEMISTLATARQLLAVRSGIDTKGVFV